MRVDRSDNLTQNEIRLKFRKMKNRDKSLLQGIICDVTPSKRTQSYDQPWFL